MTKYDDYLLNGFDDKYIGPERADRIAERAIDITECDGLLFDAVTDDEDTAAGRMYWESLRDLMEHGGEADDVQFLEAARGIYDATMKLAEQQAEREEVGR